MLEYCISKYNTVRTIISDDWTSISDIGAVYNGEELTLKSYLKVENAYIKAVQLFLELNTVSEFKIQNIELSSIRKDSEKIPPEFSLAWVYALQKQPCVKSNELDYLIRQILREHMWCKLESDKMYVHFGYDYYMYIGVNFGGAALVKQIQLLGLSIQEKASPYS